MTSRGGPSDLIVLHEHPEWQKPLFAALERRGVRFLPFDVSRAAFSNVEPLRARLYFNQASPSARSRAAAAPVEFVPYPDVPPDAVETATRIVRAAKLDVGGIEYLETPTGRRVFYDINANSNLRPSVAAAFGFDPFERVVDFLVRELAR